MIAAVGVLVRSETIGSTNYALGGLRSQGGWCLIPIGAMTMHELRPAEQCPPFGSRHMNANEY